METDSPDIPPHWLYVPAARRTGGDAQPQGRNEPGELPRIARQIAALRGIGEAELAALTTANAVAALPKLAGLL
jgi:TatD DNase family protein